MPELKIIESTIHKNLIEAALFMSSKPLNMEELMKATGIGSLGYLKEMIKDLQKDYSEKSLEILENPEGWQMKVKKDYLPRVAYLTPHADLSDGCKKTLALVIYKEPLKQSDLVKIQGTKAYEYVKDLERRGLLRGENSGHTKLLKTTMELESYFGETKDQIKKRIFQALDEKQPGKEDVDVDSGQRPAEVEEKQMTLDEYSEERSEESDNLQENYNPIEEIKKNMETVLEDDIKIGKQKELTVDDEFISEPLVSKRAKPSNLKPIKREKPVKIRLNKEKPETKIEEKKETAEKENDDKKIRKSEGLSKIKELTLEDLKK